VQTGRCGSPKGQKSRALLTTVVLPSTNFHSIFLMPGRSSQAQTVQCGSPGAFISKPEPRLEESLRPASSPPTPFLHPLVFQWVSPRDLMARSGSLHTIAIAALSSALLPTARLASLDRPLASRL